MKNLIILLTLLLFGAGTSLHAQQKEYKIVKPNTSAVMKTGAYKPPTANKVMTGKVMTAKVTDKKVVRMAPAGKSQPVSQLGSGDRIILKGRPTNRAVNPKDEGVEGKDLPMSAEGYICRPVTKDVYAGYNEHAVISRTSANLFLGEMLDGQALSKGIMRPVQGLRQPYTISTAFSSDVNGGSGRVAAHNLDGFRSAIKSALPSGSVTPADAIFDSRTINRAEDLAVFLQADYKDITTSAMVRGGLKSHKKHFTHAIKFMQVYFRANINRPQQLNSQAFFTDGTPITNDQLIVSEVGYGRMLLFIAESDYESTTVEAAIKASTGKEYAGGQTTVEGGIDYRKVLSESTIKVFAIGGGATEMIGVINNGANGIKTYLTAGANFNASNPGVPLYYKLSFVQDWADASTRVVTKTTEMKCRRASTKFQFAFNTLTVHQTDDGNGKDEIYGIGFCRLFIRHKQTNQPIQIMADRPYKGKYGRMFEIPRKSYYSMADGERRSLMPDKWNFIFDYDNPSYGGYTDYNEALNNAYWYIDFQVKEADDGTDDEVYSAQQDGKPFIHQLKDFTSSNGKEMTFRHRKKITVSYTAGPDNLDL